MSEVLLDTRDLGQAEAALSSLYADMRLSASPDPSVRFRIRETGSNPVAVHEVDYGAGFRYTAEPFERLVLCLPHSGRLEQRFAGGASAVAGSGEVVTVGAIGRPFDGVVHAGRFSLLLLEPRILDEFSSGDSAEPVRLTSAEPVSADANRHLVQMISYVRQVASTSLTGANPLLGGEIRRHVAATVLSTFPNTAQSLSPADAHRGGAPANVQRAIAYIDDNAARDISLADIAAEVSVTPRALQYMFRKHRDCTPLEYLRRVRLHHAHLELLAADPGVESVAGIARKWGFGHAGRFAAFYRDRYGETPNRTIRARS